MADAPFQQIPDSTQVHVDRMVGARLGEYEVGPRVTEGRFGTIYRAQDRASGKNVTLEVLRAELTGDDGEVKAANAIKCSGIANVFDFGQVSDGRRYRVMEHLDGESLDQLVQRSGKLAPVEVTRLLGQIAEVLQAAHAWGLPHGGLGATSVFVVAGAVKLIDFGLTKQRPSIEADLQQLGALGFTLLTGEDCADRAPPPLGSGIPESIDRFLRELVEHRVNDATAARKELAMVATLIETPQFSPAPRKSRALPLTALAIVLAGGGAAAFFLWPSTPAPATEVETPVAAEDEEGLVLDETPEVESGDAGITEAAQTGPRPPSTTGPRRGPLPVPSARALMDEISRLDARFHKKVKPGDDIDQAMYVLNKQRLRLTGEVTEKDRRDVARQLAGWRRSYLRK